MENLSLSLSLISLLLSLSLSLSLAAVSVLPGILDLKLLAVRGKMLMGVNFLVYNWCWITSSDVYRQYASGEHSPLPTIFLCIIALHDKDLVHEKATLSILDNNDDFESHAIIGLLIPKPPPPICHRHRPSAL